ncbi:MAG: hypothetical protein D6772_10790 [Bacteroidetes bacterium]|nr:MAG: hypothetical protein D6772_10790 [Bacteroidota bacterium]
MNPFDYWTSDPHGYLRHVIVGAVLVIALIRVPRWWVAPVVILLVAFGKETVDASWLGEQFSVVDIICTVAPYLFWWHNRKQEFQR